MVQSVELLLDDEGDTVFRAAWAALSAAELPSLADHGGATNAPHVTLLVVDPVEGDGMRPALDALAGVARGRSLRIRVGAPMLFGGHRDRFVLVRQVVVEEALLSLHAALAATVAEHVPGIALHPHTRPGTWTPHVTLASRIPGARIGDALAATGDLPETVGVRGLRLWDSATRTVTALG